MRTNLLVDDIHLIIETLDKCRESKKISNGKRVSIDIIVGEAGPELVCDLLFGHILLRFGICDEVHYHTKAIPTLFTGATSRDVYAAVQLLSNPVSSDVWSVRHFGEAVRDHIMSGQMTVTDDLFWCQPTAFWDMPAPVQQKLSSSALVFVKGDANYRRLLGDREWPLDLAASTVLSYWEPIPVCALRRIASPIVCGVPKSTAQRVEREDFRWQENGKWALVQCNRQSPQTVLN